MLEVFDVTLVSRPVIALAFDVILDVFEATLLSKVVILKVYELTLSTRFVMVEA